MAEQRKAPPKPARGAVVCRACGGEGFAAGERPAVCAACGGRGLVPRQSGKGAADA